MKQQHATPWWQNYFSSHYGTLYRGPLEGDLNTAGELAVLKRLFQAVEGPVLDAGCGFGRHLGPLRRARVPVVGMDWSRDLLEMVPKAHRRAAVRGDLRRMPFRQGAFAGAYLLFNTFGYFAEAENERVLGELARVMRPGGLLLMDIPARSGMSKAAREMPLSIRCQDGCTMQEDWRYDAEEKRLRARGLWEIRGNTQVWEMSMRLYTPAEIRRMLKKAGFRGEIEIRPLEELGAVGAGDGTHPAAASAWRRFTNMVVLAER